MTPAPGDWGGVRGRRVVVTGATSGIGLAAAQELARRGAHLAIVGRDPGRVAAATAGVRETAGDAAPEPDGLVADLLVQADVARLAAELLSRYEAVDVLVNNAGAMFAHRSLTPDGIEATWALNHLAPFLLTNLLLERLKSHPPARVITTASDAHRRERLPFNDLGAEGSYNGMRRYGATKLANIAFTAELGRRLGGSGVVAASFHPGLVATGFNHNNGRWATMQMQAIKGFARPPAKGAETLVWLADEADASEVNGGYFYDKKRVEPNAEAQDPAMAGRLWQVSREQTGLA